MATYKSTSEARAAFDRDMASGKATVKDWGSYYNSTANSPSGGKVTNTGNYYSYKPDGSAYYYDNNGKATQLSGPRGTSGYVNGEFKSNGNGGHTSVGYNPSLSGVNSAPRQLSADEKAHYDKIVEQAMQQKYSSTANTSMPRHGDTTQIFGETWQYNSATGQYEPTNLNLTQTGSGAWTTGKQNQVSAPTFQFNPNQYAGDNLGQEYLRKAMAAAEAAQQARINALLSQIDSKRPEIESQSADLARQAYINQRLGQQAARENLAANGLANTGVSETTNLGLQTAYQQALDEIGKNKQNALLDLDQAKVQAQQTGNADLAGIQAQYQQSLATMQQQYEQEMYNRWLNDQQMQMTQAQNEWQQQFAMQQYNNQLSQSDWERQLAMQQYNYMMQQNQLSSEADKMYKLLNQGLVTPEVLQYYGLGSTGDYYNYLNQLQRAQMVPKISGSRSASSRGGAGSEELFSSGVMPKATTNATFGGQQYQLTPNELETLFRTTTAGDIFGNLTPDDPTAYLRR